MTANANTGRRRRVSVVALVVPADERVRCDVRQVALTAGALSDAIGGGLLDEALIDTLDGARYTVYADADRALRQLPDNTRATLLAARIGWIDLVDRFHLLGDILIVGADDSGNDTDVPYLVIQAATQAGLLPGTGS